MLGTLIGTLSDWLYTYVLVILLIAAGLYFTLRTKFVQLRLFAESIRVVGEKTFGKGTYQEFHQLKNGSAVYLTVARYAGPSGVTYDETGVSADYEVQYPAELDKTTTLGNPEFDTQLRRALEIATTAVKTETSGTSETTGG